MRFLAHRCLVRASAVLFLCGVLLSTGCGSDGTTDGSGSKVAIAAIGGGSTTSEGTIASTGGTRVQSSVWARLGREMDPVSRAWAVPLCDWSSIITSCSSGSETLSFDGCSLPLDPAVKIQGSETLTWNGTGCCTSTPLSASSTTPCSYTRRTINSSGAADPMTRSVGENGITLDTEDSSGYAQAKSGGFVITCQGANGDNTCDGQRGISITGAHYTGQAEDNPWDYTVSTDQPIIEQGHDSSRKVLSAVVRVQHNRLQMTSISTVTSTLTYASDCCFPSGGGISTTYSGGKLDGKTETMTFGPGCGQATLNNSDQQSTGLTLHHCL